MAYNTNEERFVVKGSERITRDLQVNHDTYVNGSISSGNIYTDNATVNNIYAENIQLNDLNVTNISAAKIGTNAFSVNNINITGKITLNGSNGSNGETIVITNGKPEWKPTGGTGSFNNIIVNDGTIGNLIVNTSTNITGGTFKFQGHDVTSCTVLAEAEYNNLSKDDKRKPIFYFTVPNGNLFFNGYGYSPSVLPPVPNYSVWLNLHGLNQGMTTHTLSLRNATFTTNSFVNGSGIYGIQDGGIWDNNATVYVNASGAVLATGANAMYLYNIGNMYKDCHNLTDTFLVNNSLITNAPTNYNPLEHVINMEGAFLNCTNFNKKINIPENVNSLYQTFRGSGYNQNVFTLATNLSRAFENSKFNSYVGYNSLTVNNYYRMFYNCTDFNYPGLYVNNPTANLAEMFSNCTNLSSSGDVISINSSVSNVAGLFANCNTSKHKGIIFYTNNANYLPFVSNNPSNSIVYAPITFTTNGVSQPGFGIEAKNSLHNISLYLPEYSSNYNLGITAVIGLHNVSANEAYELYLHNSYTQNNLGDSEIFNVTLVNLPGIYGEATVNTNRALATTADDICIINASHAFDGCSNLWAVFPQIENYDYMNNIVDASYMFRNCNEFGLAGFSCYGSNLINASHMFENCSNISIETEGSSVPVSFSPTIEDASFMFANCPNVLFIHECRWSVPDVYRDSYNLRNAHGMFYNSGILYGFPAGGLGLPYFQNLEDASEMFKKCINFNGTTLVESLLGNYEYCRNVTTVASMCENCTNLDFEGRDLMWEKIPDNASSVFRNCINLNMYGPRLPQSRDISRIYENTSFLQGMVEIPINVVNAYRCCYNINAREQADYVYIHSTSITNLSEAFTGITATSVRINEQIPKSTSNYIYNMLVNGGCGITFAPGNILNDL